MECRYRYVPITAVVIGGLLFAVLTARPGARGVAFGADGGSGFDLTISDAPPATLDAPRHHARYLVKPNPLQNLATGERVVVATGLPTRAVGITSIPGFNLTADIAVRPSGEILVTGSGDGSVVDRKLR